jgi:hypothetical protein
MNKDEIRLRWIAAHGGEGVLNEGDVDELNKGVLEALMILVDGLWHTGIEIKQSHSQGMGEALRRVRDLRPLLESKGFEVESERTHDNRRVFQYRIRRVPSSEPEQGQLAL